MIRVKTKAKASVEREMTVIERIERLKSMALRAKGVYDENCRMGTKTTKEQQNE